MKEKNQDKHSPGGFAVDSAAISPNLPANLHIPSSFKVSLMAIRRPIYRNQAARVAQSKTCRSMGDDHSRLCSTAAKNSDPSLSDRGHFFGCPATLDQDSEKRDASTTPV